jgi:hypothetical protein
MKKMFFVYLEKESSFHSLLLTVQLINIGFFFPEICPHNLLSLLQWKAWSAQLYEKIDPLFLFDAQCISHNLYSLFFIVVFHTFKQVSDS